MYFVVEDGTKDIDCIDLQHEKIHEMSYPKKRRNEISAALAITNRLLQSSLFWKTSEMRQT